MIKREISQKILDLSEKFPVITVTGPRQSGKTTLLKKLFGDLFYASLENPETRMFAIQDPKNFLSQYANGGIIDEAQLVPELFSYIQGIVDQSGKTGQFILSGSQSFLLHDRISQSLAGRTAIFRLLPFSFSELRKAGQLLPSYEANIFHGFFPRLYDKKIDPPDFYPNYIQTYLERDVRSLQNIHDLNLFVRFLGLCAGRVGQLLDYTSLANDCGVSYNTVKAWISVLEASYILFLLQPHHNNFSKRLVKRPKLYFYDTGLCCSLLRIEKVSQLDNHYLKGSLFENLILSEFLKRRYNQGKASNLYFWRDHRGMEVDLIIEHVNGLTPVEIKSGKTWNRDFFMNLEKWNGYSGNLPENSHVVYGGDDNFKNSWGTIHSWNSIDDIDS
jgi:predicted AAA+ superfamily ATPase